MPVRVNIYQGGGTVGRRGKRCARYTLSQPRAVCRVRPYQVVDQLPGRGGEPGLEVIMPAQIGRDELRTLTGQGAQLVEVLPAGDYDWAHLPGAVNLPLKELDARAGELDRSRPVIVYCHDWY